MFKTCEYQMAVDGREDVPNPNGGEGHFRFVPKSDRMVILEIYHGCHDNIELEHQIRKVRVEGNVTTQELIECINEYLDMYVNPSEKYREI